MIELKKWKDINMLRVSAKVMQMTTSALDKSNAWRTVLIKIVSNDPLTDSLEHTPIKTWISWYPSLSRHWVCRLSTRKKVWLASRITRVCDTRVNLHRLQAPWQRTVTWRLAMWVKARLEATPELARGSNQKIHNCALLSPKRRHT